MNQKHIKQFIIALFCVVIAILSITLISNAVTTINTNITTEGTLSVSGSATTSGSHYIGNDLTVLNGNVGIGTTTPDARLDIGKTAASHNPLFMISSSTAGDMLTVDRNGNVGIGTTSPDVELEVFGTGNVVAKVTSGSLETTMQSSNSYGWIGTITSGHDFYMGAGNTAWIVIDAASGNVGMGDASPDGKFELSADGVGGTGELFLLSSNDSNDGDIVTVLNDGSFGIGTTSPAAPLDVFTTATTTMVIDSNAAAKGSCLKFKDVDGGGYTYCYFLNGNISCSTNSCE